MRLVGSPYKPTDPNCRHLAVPFDEKTSKVSPLVLRQVLIKFQIPYADFMQALEDSRVESIASRVRKRPTGSEG